MSRFKLYFSIFSLCFNFCYAQISDKRFCVDAECNSPVSHAKTLTTYFAKDLNQLSFKPNEKVIIYSKSAGSNGNLWGAEIGGKRGYVPARLVRETKILGTPTLLVDAEINTVSNVPQVPETVKPSKVKQSYEVIDGTTIYSQLDDNLTELTEAKDENTALHIFVNDSNLNEDKAEASIETEATESDSGTGNVEDDNVELEGIKYTQKEKNKNVEFYDLDPNSKLTSNLEFSIGEINVATEHSDTDDELKEGTIGQSGESEHSNSDKAENYSGMLSNVIGMMMDAIDGKDNNENGDPEQFEEEKIAQDFNINDEAAEGDSKPQVPMNKSVGVVNKHENHSEVKLPESSDMIQENYIQNEDGSLKKDETDELAHVGEQKVESSDGNNSGPVDDQNNEVSKEREHNLREDKLSNSLDNNQEKLIKQEKSPSSDSLRILTDKFDTMEPLADPAANKNMVDDLVYRKFDSSVDSVENLDIVDQNISSSNKSITPSTDAENPNFASISNKSLFETTPVDANKSEEIKDIQYKVSEETINQPKVLDKEIENRINKPENVVLDTTENLYGVIASYTDTTADNDDEQENNLANDAIHHFKYMSNNNEKRKQKAESEDNIEKQKTISDEYFNMERSNSADDKIKPFDQLDSQNLKQKLVNTGVSDSILESYNGYEDNIKYDIESQESKQDQIDSPIDEIENKSDVEILQKSHGIFSEFSSTDQQKIDDTLSEEKMNMENSEKTNGNVVAEQENNFYGTLDVLPTLSSEFCLYLITTAVSVIIFLLGYFALDKSRREAPLVAKINHLEKEFLILLKEKELLAEKMEDGARSNDYINSTDFLNLQKQYKDAIKEKEDLKIEMQALEKELENSTEVGLELNRMLSDILSSENAGSILTSNIEKLQAQLVEQQGIVSNMKEMLRLKDTENHELHLELEISNKKVIELQSELDRLLLNVIKLEEEKTLQERNSESKISKLKVDIDAMTNIIKSNEKEYIEKVDDLKNKLCTSERNLQIKIKEFDGMKNSMQEIKNLKNGNTLDSILELNSIKAELEQLQTECNSYCEKLRLEQENNIILEKKAKLTEDEADAMKKRYDEVDKARLELETKLQVLTTYFKDKEAQLQKELSRYESMWSAKQGEATSTSERIKYLQSEVQNFKAQNELLKQEIVSQEVELKSQISVLEKKVHENWVTARQAERRLEDLKQEAAHLRNRLTLSERALQDDKIHNRIQSPLDQKIDLPVSPLQLDSPSSPLLYDSRDHITKSPPILGIPPPFLPPPPGNPFLPPPHLPFMPPPLPDMFPGDRRPPPLGRMSSPPLNSRYSPDRRSYSPYDRRSPSPSYDESEYGTSPVRHRRYSPFNHRTEHRTRMGRINGRSGELSSGSGNSNESLNGLSHPNAKV